ncbi:asparaginase [Pseudomonas sp. Irchel s3b6]|uniref:asparaginase n=1 Tax=Pseudomonas sp. Irchel s3b6 TaxID=2009078 RepID=UPI000BA459CA|nr:asparaginase [Pseudomonas sp. Irchel s3b6]
MNTQDSIAAIVYRGEAVENTHMAHIAVVDAQGQLLCGFGNPLRMTLTRSAVKPAQALAILETGALEAFGLDESDLALMCASHSSEERHIRLTRDLLAKSGATEADMRCGGHPPIGDAVYLDWIRRDFQPTPACSNCSGKHAGMLAAAKALGQPLEGYHLAQHPLQRRVMDTVAAVCEVRAGSIQWAIDGCNLPTPAFALDRLALLFAKLAAASDTTTPREAALARIYQAMTRHPELVAGEGRFCTALMKAYAGQLVGKVGADASYAIGVRGSDGQPARGIAVKVEDGHQGVLYAVVCEVLEQLNIGSAEQRQQLSAWHHPPMMNTMKVPTGRMALTFALAPRQASDPGSITPVA